MATDLVTHENALDGDFLIRLAAEIAQDLNDLNVVLQKHNITADQWVELEINPFFRKVLEAERTVWRSPLNAAERSKVKAAILTEQALPELDRRIQNGQEPLDKVVQGIKLLASIAGLGEKAQQSGLGSADKFVIQINMGAGSENYVKDKQPVGPLIEGAAVEVAR
jgi:hypothetical protein